MCAASTYCAVEGPVSLVLGARKFDGVFAPYGILPDRISTMLYVRFDLGVESIAALRDRTQPARIECSHPRDRHSVELAEATREELASDFDPANGERAPR